MWKRLADYRLQRAGSRNAAISAEELGHARSVLFAVFSRYGDSVITFKVLDEFLRRYPGKRCMLVTTPQALPYAQAIIRSDVNYYALNKRRSVLTMARLFRDLRRDPPDLGFNPWSHGKESQALISFAERFHLFTDFAATAEWRNHYQRVRQYLHLPDPAVERPSDPPKDVARIVLAPFSTDRRRSLSADDVARLLRLLENRFPGARATLALFAREARAVDGLGGTRFFFGKTRRDSEQFLALLRDSDLFVGVDAGPLHLADALGIPCFGLFGPTPPERVVDRQSRVLPLRVPGLTGYLCDIRSCADPLCLHRLVAGASLSIPVTVDFDRVPQAETTKCRAVEHLEPAAK
jgi:ADP-heptose:LPS heptosyltransferase